MLLIRVFLMVSVGACASDGFDVGQVTQHGSSLNGSSLNGSSLNGSSLNGSSLNGSSLNGSSLNGSSLNGSSLNGSSLNGLMLVGSTFQADGVSSLVGAIFVGQLSDGRSIDLRIDAISWGTGSNADVALHEVSVKVDQGWLPLCEDSAGTRLPAIVLAGHWSSGWGVSGGGSKTTSPGLFTFACRGGALAKCVENLGYKPWVSPAHASLHQTCTRAIRADYCGNGASWTANGRAINIYDNQGVQEDTERWGPEAEWSESGARCIFRQRVLDLGSGLPSCILSKESPTCGLLPGWSWGTLITNEAYDILIEGP